MLELGDQAPMLHREMGELAATVGLSHLFLHGNMADHVLEGALSKGFPRKRILTGSHGALVDGLKKIITPGMWILVKGSRGMHMEHIVTALQQRLGEKD
jgi:UDP-N-acetylmuramyl pentapeptide synthase